LLRFDGADFVAEGRHLRRNTAGTDHFQRFGLPQAFETLGQQRRADASEPGFAVAGGAVFPVQRRRAVRAGQG
jgi:hypothetical protein